MFCNVSYFRFSQYKENSYFTFIFLFSRTSFAPTDKIAASYILLEKGREDHFQTCLDNHQLSFTYTNYKCILKKLPNMKGIPGDFRIISLPLILQLKVVLTENTKSWKLFVCPKRKHENQGYLWNTFTQVLHGFTFQIQFIQRMAKSKRNLQDFVQLKKYY